MTTTTNDATKAALLDVYQHAGTLQATVHAPMRSDVADAEQRFEIRRGNVLKLLDDAGAPTALITLVDGALERREHDDAPGLLLVATEEALLLDAASTRPPDRAEVHLGPTPQLLGALAATRTDIGHAAVLIDRVGADVWYRSGVGDPVEAAQVEGDDLHVHRGHPGGWSQRRFQQRAENTWESNARLAVDEVVEMLPADVDVIVVGGDVRAAGFFAEHLPSGYQLVEVDGSRSSDHDAFLEAVDTEIRSHAARCVDDEVAVVRDAIGAGGGLSGHEVLDALGQGRVDRLLVVDDSQAADRAMRMFDFSVPMVIDPSVATRPDGAAEAPMTDGAVALAVARGTDVVVVPSTEVADVDGRLAAVLR